VGTHAGGDPYKDICRVTRYQQVETVGGKNRIVVAGANTVNTETGEMAKQVEIFAELIRVDQLGPQTLIPRQALGQRVTVTTVPAQITSSHRWAGWP